MKLSTIILLPLLGALLNGSYALWLASRRQSGSRALVNIVGVGLPFAAFAVAVYLSWPFLHGRTEPNPQNLFSWIAVGNFQVSAALLLDRLSVVMVLVVTGVGSLIHLYSTGYMREDPGYAKYFAYLNLFLASMLILVLGDSLLTLFVGWEGVGLCSYLLIGFWFEDPEKAYAGKKAFVVNRIGDFGFLIGIFLVLAVLLPLTDSPAPVLSYSYLQAHASWLQGMVPWITLCFFVGAVGKSAQIPLYVWLPDAMAGPTPVSALIHAATMVTAGVYMIARLHFLYDMAPQTLELVAWVGAITAIFAASIALVQNDIKKVLAYSTISQLGYMFLAMGIGAYTAGIFHLLTHAFFKACLFLGAGAVIHGLSGEQDIRKMGGLWKALPVTALCFGLATLAIAGIPPFSGFFSKDEILWQAMHRGHAALWAVGLCAASLTSFYMFRLGILTFLGKSRSHEHVHHPHEAPLSMTSVLAILGVLSLLGGLLAIPPALGGHNMFHEWLGIGHASEHGGAAELRMERLLMAASVAVALLGALLAWLFYLKSPSIPNILAARLQGLYRLLLNKYYVDEVYQALIVLPLRELSDRVLRRRMDEQLIDGMLVNGSGRTVSWIGSLVSHLQGGLVNSYALYFFLALCGALLLAVVF